jgi:hypothetical protein
MFLYTFYKRISSKYIKLIMLPKKMIQIKLKSRLINANEKAWKKTNQKQGEVEILGGFELTLAC